MKKKAILILALSILQFSSIVKTSVIDVFRGRSSSGQRATCTEHNWPNSSWCCDKRSGTPPYYPIKQKCPDATCSCFDEPKFEKPIIPFRNLI